MGLTKVYITVGLNEMAKKIGNVSPEELELILIEMVREKRSNIVVYGSLGTHITSLIDQPKSSFCFYFSDGSTG